MTTKNKQAARAKARAACLFGGLLETSTFPGSRFRLFKRKQVFLSELIGKQPDRIRQRPSDRNGPPDPAHAECGYGGQQICRRDARAQRNDRENHAHSRFSQRTVVSHVSHHNQNKSTVHRTVLLFCLWATKKIFSAVLRMTSNSRKNLYSVNHICDFYFIIRE